MKTILIILLREVLNAEDEAGELYISLARRHSPDEALMQGKVANYMYYRGHRTAIERALWATMGFEPGKIAEQR